MRRLTVVATLLTLLVAAAVKPVSAMSMYGGGGGMDVGKTNIYGDNWALFKSVSYDESVYGSEKSDSAFFYRIRAGLFGKLDDRNGYKFRFSTTACGSSSSGYGVASYQSAYNCGQNMYGTRFGGTGVGNPNVSLEHGYLFYRWSDRTVTYAGRVPTYVLNNDLLFSSGSMRGNDRAYDGLFWSFDMSDNTNLYLGWGRLYDTPGNGSKDDFILGQLKHDFSDTFWAYVGAANITCEGGSCDSHENDFTAFFLKAWFGFSPEFGVNGEFLSSNGQVNGGDEVENSDTAAFMLGASYKASEQWTIEANWANIGGSSVAPTSFVTDDYVMNALSYGPRGSEDTDLTYFNLHLHYLVNDHNTAMFDYTHAEESSDYKSTVNAGDGFLVSWGTTYG
ncbi:MAG: hypothetical protein ACREJQ_06065 [bacterium]